MTQFTWVPHLPHSAPEGTFPETPATRALGPCFGERQDGGPLDGQPGLVPLPSRISLHQSSRSQASQATLGHVAREEDHLCPRRRFLWRPVRHDSHCELELASNAWTAALTSQTSKAEAKLWDCYHFVGAFRVPDRPGADAFQVISRTRWIVCYPPAGSRRSRYSRLRQALRTRVAADPLTFRSPRSSIDFIPTSRA